MTSVAPAAPRLPEFLDRWRGNPATTSQIARLERLAAALRATPGCLGAALLGSFAKGSADRLSDLDLVVFCADGASQAVFDAIGAQIAPSDTLMTFDGRHAPDSPYRALIFNDFTSCEFHVIPPTLPFALKQPYVELLSRDGCLAGRVCASPAPGRDALPVYHGGDPWLAWELLDCIKWLSRGDTAAAKRHLVRLGQAISAADSTGTAG
ncbi:nucleotidyltransferase domain-containing protein [Burkholderia alba]|uniref:nucleotidyltransferase domain-containing protein n=1 Tax=Burkholderia alba TaxID=2683677 RepID=UPI002B05FBDD|nr:nucleotidyltransferase domain-containing protein [Burkholderia alba]